MIDPQLPKEIESERYGIGAGLIYGAEAEPLFTDASLYFDEGNRVIVAEMGRLWRDSGSVDRKVLAREVCRKSSLFKHDELFSYLLELVTDIYTVAHVELHLKRLKAARDKRALFTLTNDASADALNGKPASTIANDLLASLYDWQREQQEVPQLVQASTVEPASIRYIWEPWLPEAMFTMFDGDPGFGKSQLACYVFAQITNGGAFPFASNRCQPRNVLMIAGEDSAETTIVPRLKATGSGSDWLRTAGYELCYGRPRLSSSREENEAQYETELAYLDRLGLLTEAERKELL